MSDYNIPAMKQAERALLRQIRMIFNKYNISQSDRSTLHTKIRAVGMIKLRLQSGKASEEEFMGG